MIKVYVIPHREEPPVTWRYRVPYHADGSRCEHPRRECKNKECCNGKYWELPECQFPSPAHKFCYDCQLAAAPECVYVVHAGFGEYKIGKTRCISDRLAEIGEATLTRVKPVILLSTENIDDLERTLHKTFKSKRTHGEWFRLDDDDLEQIKRMGKVVVL